MLNNNLLTSFLDVMSDPNQTLQQYTRGFGHPPLIGALSRLYTKLLNRPTDINPNTEVLVTVINLVWPSFLTYLHLLSRYRPRVFDQVEHQTMGNKHFFTK